MGILELWIILILSVVSLQIEVLNAQNLSCNSNDLKALEGFVKGLDSVIDVWKFDTNSFLHLNCCDWEGVTCSSSSSLGLNNDSNSMRLVKLELPKKRLLGKLSELVGSLDQLKILNFSHNALKGRIPQSLLLLPNLEVLDLNNNGFSGVFPMNINLPSIQVFDVSQNSFGGFVPAVMCNTSPHIRVMNLAVNYFNGSVPLELGKCGSLEFLDLGSNHLSGSIPDELFRLPNLATLTLRDNNLLGELSYSSGNLTNLVHLDISSNRFSGSIPDVFGGLSKLENFIAHSNNLTGQIPVSLSNSHTIVALCLRNNSLDGLINFNCSAMTNVVLLDLASNRFHGPIPDTLPSCPRLRTLNLARINLTGQIPESFKNFSSLSSLSLSNSSIYNISSALGILQHCQNLTTLILSLNFHAEELPSAPDLQFKALKILVIANCKLTGTIPQWLRISQQLQLLDLSWNQLGGTIPFWFGSFNYLFYLDLSNNSLIGEIPKGLTGLQSFIFRDISLEEPSPDFPLFMKRNNNTRALQYNQLLSFPPKLDLSSNFLNGSIWSEFGNLHQLHILDLKYNKLSGSIPDSLSGMISLECLDLSHNNLSGKIPSSLVRLSFLSTFSIAYNKLSGAIPTGGQFPTFPNSSFEGNQDLCGEHFSPCEVTSQFHGNEKPNRKRGTIIGTVGGIGFGTFSLLALMIFIVRRPVNQGVGNHAKEADGNDNGLEGVGSKLVVFFHNKEDNKELSLDDILESTDSFDQANIIGCGGFGLVYKATLPDGTKVAIKRLSGDAGQMDREFQAEVETLSRAQHPNLVHLQGYCNYKNDKLIIYSYMENGSLDYWLHEKIDGPSSLDWVTRLKIAQGAARGLAYLHESCEPHILHRDIKSSNILLDEKFVAHLADFGLARLIRPYDTHVTTDLVGTLGYIPPEYGQASVATYKGDVYSFGVVLLELLTGKRPMDMCKPRANRDLISWVMQMKGEKRESEVFDPFVYDKEHANEMLLVLEIACLCLSENPKVRPSTQQLVSWLNNFDLNNN